MIKLLIVCLLMTQSNYEFEHLIDQPINIIKFGIVDDGNSANENAKIFGVTNFKKKYFGKTVETMAVSTDNNNKITSVAFTLKGKLDEELYKLLVEELGDPEHIYKKGEAAKKELKEYDNGSYVLSGSGELIECSFDDNPYLIVWNRPNCQLRFVLNPYSNSTQVMFYKSKFNK